MGGENPIRAGSGRREWPCFQSDYISRVIEIGEADAQKHRTELSRLVLG